MSADVRRVHDPRVDRDTDAWKAACERHRPAPPRDAKRAGCWSDDLTNRLIAAAVALILGLAIGLLA